MEWHGATGTTTITNSFTVSGSSTYKKVLITGAFGFIGYKLAERMLEGGDITTHITMLGHSEPPPHVAELAARHKARCTIMVHDVAELDETNAPDVDEVYHLAATKSTTNDVPCGAMIFNIESDINIVALYGDNPRVKILYMSTGEVIGPFTEALATQEKGWPAAESQPIASVTITDASQEYALSKIAGEMHMRHGKLRAAWVIARLQNPYGPRMGDNTLIPQLIKAAVKPDTPAPSVYVNDTRPFIFIDDVVTGLILAMERSHINQKVVNICGKERTVEEVVNALIRVAGGVTIRFKPLTKEQHMPYHRRALRCTTLEEIGWRPWVDLDEGVRRMWDFYKLKFIS